MPPDGGPRRVPVGTPHCFKNETDRAVRRLISVAPAGLEQMFFEVGQPVPAGAQTTPSPTKDEIETRDIPAGMFAAGNPCRFIRDLTEAAADGQR